MEDEMISETYEDEYDDDDARYCLTEWGCLYLVLSDYGIKADKISGRMGKHIVEDFMYLMNLHGHLKIEKNIGGQDDLN